MQKNNKYIALRVSTVSVIVNMILSVFKLLAGIIGNSSAMISDAVHSASDVFSTFIVIIGVNMSSKESDAEHPYGHERLECIAAFILAATLFATGIGIGYAGINKIFFEKGNIEVPKYLPLVAAIFSIAIKEGMYWYTRNAAKKIKSDVLMADAWHHRSDALSSVGSFIGILGALFGYPVFDPIASVVICLFIIKAAYDVFSETVKKLVDTSCEQSIVDEIRCEVLKQNDVVCVDELKTRMFGSKIYVDLEIGADETISFKKAHAVAENVHHAIEKNFPEVKHCMVHVNPVKVSKNESIK